MNEIVPSHSIVTVIINLFKISIVTLIRHVFWMLENVFLDLCSNVSLLTLLQILSLLPPYEGKSVLELGAGIGRFTGELVKTAGHVLAMDFIESVIKKV